jgi:hypothetical protein
MRAYFTRCMLIVKLTQFEDTFTQH